MATTLLGEVGGRRDEPKAEQKIVLRSRVLRNYCLEGLLRSVPSSFVLHCNLLGIDHLNCQHTGEFDQNFSKKSKCVGVFPGGGGGTWAVLEFTDSAPITRVNFLWQFLSDEFYYFALYCFAIVPTKTRHHHTYNYNNNNNNL